MTAARARKSLTEIQAAINARPRMRGDMDPELVVTDRILQRWAASIGSGLPIEDGGERRSQVPPLDDDTAVLVDQEVQKAPGRVRIVVKQWYKVQAPWEALARELGCRSRSSVYIHISTTLWYLKGRFEALGICG